LGQEERGQKVLLLAEAQGLDVRVIRRPLDAVIGAEVVPLAVAAAVAVGVVVGTA